MDLRELFGESIVLRTEITENGSKNISKVTPLTQKTITEFHSLLINVLTREDTTDNCVAGPCTISNSDGHTLIGYLSLLIGTEKELPMAVLEDCLLAFTTLLDTLRYECMKELLVLQPRDRGIEQSILRELLRLLVELMEQKGLANFDQTTSTTIDGLPPSDSWEENEVPTTGAHFCRPELWHRYLDGLAQWHCVHGTSFVSRHLVNEDDEDIWIVQLMRLVTAIESAILMETDLLYVWRLEDRYSETHWCNALLRHNAVRGLLFKIVGHESPIITLIGNTKHLNSLVKSCLQNKDKSLDALASIVGMIDPIRQNTSMYIPSSEAMSVQDVLDINGSYKDVVVPFQCGDTLKNYLKAMAQMHGEEGLGDLCRILPIDLLKEIAEAGFAGPTLNGTGTKGKDTVVQLRHFLNLRIRDPHIECQLHTKISSLVSKYSAMAQRLLLPMWQTPAIDAPETKSTRSGILYSFLQKIVLHLCDPIREWTRLSSCGLSDAVDLVMYLGAITNVIPRYLAKCERTRPADKQVPASQLLRQWLQKEVEDIVAQNELFSQSISIGLSESCHALLASGTTSHGHRPLLHKWQAGRNPMLWGPSPAPQLHVVSSREFILEELLGAFPLLKKTTEFEFQYRSRLFHRLMTNAFSCNLSDGNLELNHSNEAKCLRLIRKMGGTAIGQKLNAIFSSLIENQALEMEFMRAHPTLQLSVVLTPVTESKKEDGRPDSSSIASNIQFPNEIDNALNSFKEMHQKLGNSKNIEFRHGRSTALVKVYGLLPGDDEAAQQGTKYGHGLVWVDAFQAMLLDTFNSNSGLTEVDLINRVTGNKPKKRTSLTSVESNYLAREIGPLLTPKSNPILVCSITGGDHYYSVNEAFIVSKNKRPECYLPEETYLSQYHESVVRFQALQKNKPLNGTPYKAVLDQTIVLKALECRLVRLCKGQPPIAMKKLIADALEGFGHLPMETVEENTQAKQLVKQLIEQLINTHYLERDAKRVELIKYKPA